MYDENLFAHEVHLSPKENYFRVLDGREPEWLPSYFNKGRAAWTEDLLTPMIARERIVTPLGVPYVGEPDTGYGAMVEPGEPIIPDITHWRDYWKLVDYSDFDFASYYAKKLEPIDRSKYYICIGGGDYFLTLVALLGFEETMIAFYEEPEYVHELLDEIHRFYLLVNCNQLEYLQPEMISTMDDICSKDAPFFGMDVYDEFFRPLIGELWSRARERGMYIGHHCCGPAAPFLERWFNMGLQTWNPAQPMNDLVAIKEHFDGFTIEGGWDSARGSAVQDEEELRQMVIDYIDKLAPGGHFVFWANTYGNPSIDSKATMRSRILKEVYFDYAFDYYRTH